MSLDQKIKARAIALEITDKDINQFVLKKASVYEASLLKDIATHKQFLDALPKKIPSWQGQTQLLSHQGINLEQSSSEATALFKATLVSGERGLDLTGGFGVDAYFMGKSFKQYHHNEPSKTLSEVVAYNFKQLGVVHTTFSQHFAEEFPFENQFYDCIFLDPSRRDNHAQKVFKIEDCIPNVHEIQDHLLEHSSQILIKYSPMLDIKQALGSLKQVKKVFIVADKNEVKELLFLIEKGYNALPTLTSVNLNSRQPNFSFTIEEEKNASTVYAPIQNYLYEPNAAILKAGAFQVLTQYYPVRKIAQHSHLYTSENVLVDFPGRIFKVEEVTKYDKKSLKFKVPQGKANISTRNFPLKPEEIKKQLKWKDGGEDYLFFTTDCHDRKVVVICKKL